MNKLKLTWGQVAVLVAASLPMVATGVAGAVATFVNMRSVLPSDATAMGIVAAGEGATFICALVSLAVTLMGQHTPATVRAGLWLLPVAASGLGIYLAPGHAMAAVMAATPLAMTVSGEGITLVARRIVAYRTGVDIEQQRRSGLLLWHANRAANGRGIGKWLSTAAVWRLTKAFAATDAQMSVQLGEVQRYRIGEGADQNLAAVLSGSVGSKPEKAPALPPVAPAVLPGPTTLAGSYEPVTSASVPFKRTEGRPVTLEIDDNGNVESVNDPDGWGFVAGVLAEAEERVASDPTVGLLTVAEVAKMKGVSPGTVRSWKHRRKLPVYDTIDGSPMFHPNDVAKLT